MFPFHGSSLRWLDSVSEALFKTSAISGFGDFVRIERSAFIPTKAKALSVPSIRSRRRISFAQWNNATSHETVIDHCTCTHAMPPVLGIDVITASEQLDHHSVLSFIMKTSDSSVRPYLLDTSTS